MLRADAEAPDQVGSVAPTRRPGGPFWYRRFRGTAYAFLLASLAWTVAIVLPTPPFSYIPPIIVGGGPGIWFLLGYLLFVLLGVGGVGSLAGMITTVELHELRSIDSKVMWPGFVLLVAGVAGSCLLLGVAGAAGGYASVYGSPTSTPINTLLAPFVDPITATTMTAVTGAALTVLAMARAKWPST